MYDPNPYEPPRSSNDDDPTKVSPSILNRVVWSIGCIVFGVSIGWLLPEILMILNIYWEPRGPQDWSTLVVFEMSVWACLLAGCVGAIAGAVSPGKQSLLTTLKALMVADIISIMICSFSDGGKGYSLLYLSSLLVKLLTAAFIQLLIARNKAMA